MALAVIEKRRRRRGQQRALWVRAWSGLAL